MIGVDVDFEMLRHAFDSQDPRTLYSDLTLDSYLRAQEKDRAKVAVWREGFPTAGARVEFDRQLREYEKRKAANGHDHDALPLPRVLDLAALSASEPQQPRFVIPDWLPCGEVTLFAGHGGSGKSAIALLAAVCIASGREFYGLQVQRQRIVYFSLEDGADVLHWRLSRVCSWLGVEMEALAGWLTVVDATTGEMSLMVETRDGPSLTSAYAWLKERVQPGYGAVIDGASDAFDGDENARRSVRRFVRVLRRLIGPDGFVLLLAHVDKATVRAGNSTQGYSGSTAWSNSVRARWYLRPDGEDGSLLLELQKANHAPAGASMRLQWNESAHLFVGELAMPASKLDRELADSDERAAILDALRGCADSQPVVVVPAALTGQRTAHHVLCVRPEFPDSLRSGKPAIRRFWQQIERLRAMGAIEETSIRRSDRHYVRQFVVSADSARACGQ
ncbi:MAG: AAA family ATPase [Burkholderiaceae bacterium]|nr:AAA family ATPase [Burkholderiaceae bacterium]